MVKQGNNTDTLAEQIQAVNAAMLKAWSGALAYAPGGDFASTYRQFVSVLADGSEQWGASQRQYCEQQFRLWREFLGRSVGAPPEADCRTTDRRFSAAEWSEYPLFDYLRQSYLLAANWLTDAVDKLELDAAAKRRLTFFARQYIDAVAPSNFLPTNPEALKLALETKGESVLHGMRQFMEDASKGRISMTDEEAFEVGKNVAVSPGAVIYRNELIELIQYSPLTQQVYERPLLMVPPCINKFYIMDLEPDNSFVRYAVSEGHTVFMVSWRNVKQDQQHLTWDDYLNLGVLSAIEQTCAITKQSKINVLGFCVGGTLLAAALAVLAARKQEVIASLTLMTALLDFGDVGDIGVYIDDNVVRQREQQFKHGGLVSGKELAMAFSSLRANDLIWTYVVNNYLKGKRPPAFDLLYWNSDATNLPGPMYAYYLRNCYHHNDLVKAKKLTMCGEAIDLGKIRVPSYVFAAREDHIVPWKSAFASTRFLGGKSTFVLGASGHIAGSMNPVSKNKRNFWMVSGAAPREAEQWLERAQAIEGSWWRHWSAWLAQHAGHKKAARRALGGPKQKPLEAAPGSYVLQRL